MKKLAPVLLLVSVAAAADVLLKNAGANIGPVTSINCMTDGGVLCARDAGSVGTIWCNPATATEKGCVTATTQTFAGDKTWSGDSRLIGHAHASLTACDGAHKGNQQFCTDHNTPVWCNGTSNLELYGSSGGTSLLAILTGQRLFYSLTGYLGDFTLPYAYTVTSVAGTVQAGTGTAAIINLQFYDGANTCTCAVHCDTAVIDACAGNCSYAANTRVVVSPANDGCTTPPTLRSNLMVSGYR